MPLQLPYELLLEFYGEIDPKASKIHVGSRNVKVNVGKVSYRECLAGVDYLLQGNDAP